MFNDILPIKFYVKEKLLFNRYKLQINKKELSTKSNLNLELNTYYIAEIYNNNLFKNLQKIKTFYYLNIDCFKLLEFAFSKDYKNILINSLLACTNKAEYECYKLMLIAYFNDILYLPCTLNENAILIEYRKKNNCLAVYYDVFAKLSLFFDTNLLQTSFFKVKEYFLNDFSDVQITEFKDDFFKLEFKGKA